MLTQSVPCSRFENRELVDPRQENVQLGLLIGSELIPAASYQQFVQTSLRRWGQFAVGQCLQLVVAHANQKFRVVVHHGSPVHFA